MWLKLTPFKRCCGLYRAVLCAFDCSGTLNTAAFVKRNASCVSVHHFSKFIQYLYVWWIVWHTRTPGSVSTSAKWKMVNILKWMPKGMNKAVRHVQRRSLYRTLRSRTITTATQPPSSTTATTTTTTMKKGDNSISSRNNNVVDK